MSTLTERPALFQTGDFTLASGQKSSWKIECDSLTPADWAGLAAIAVTLLPKFSAVSGVPRGGVPFAAALMQHVTPGTGVLLIAEDVCTTGKSMEKWKTQLMADPAVRFGGVLGVCAFARERIPHWVTPIFRLPVTYKIPDDGE